MSEPPFIVERMFYRKFDAVFLTGFRKMLVIRFLSAFGQKATVDVSMNLGGRREVREPF
ncbi:MAG TPA: hypothetical protein VN643_10775 [Pyrinomonadaceae bacterium]|nr:hypothetical protein [Pyrinomonadaceae bacterium]